MDALHATGAALVLDDGRIAWPEGVAGTHAMRQPLRWRGRRTLRPAGQKFDPNLHEAVSQQETKDVPEGQVLQQLRKGYKLRDRLLRPATVIVAKKPA